MIILLCLVSSLHSILSVGAPVASDSTTGTTGSSAESAPRFLTNDRSTIQIIWTCSAIIFASSWVCIHPHVPGYQSTKIQRWGIRLRLFLNALLFPDQFVGRAFYEWAGSKALHSQMRERIDQINREVALEAKQDGEKAKNSGLEAEGSETTCACSVSREKANIANGKAILELVVEDREWTMVHAHFIHMGGVVFKGPDDAGDVWFKDFQDWTNEDIKGFFALRLSKEKIQDFSKADGLAKAFVIIQCLWFVVQCIGRASYDLPLIELEVTCLAYIACNIGMYVFWWYKPLNVACPERIQSTQKLSDVRVRRGGDVFPWFMAIIETLVTGDIGLLIFPSRGYDNNVNPRSARFPVNYYYKHESWGKFVEPLGQTVPLAIFGALHAIAWHGPFPTLAEKLLWRSSSIAPAILAVILLTYSAASQLPLWAWAETVLKYAAFFTIPISFAARLGFIVLPLFQFRDLPPLAYQTVPWSDFLPHV